jgi:type II secretory pathway pseudopilin PulG
VKHRAFMLLDVILGLAVIGLLIVILMSSVRQYGQAASALADSRRLARAAEAAMIELQLGRAPQPPDEVRITVNVLDETPAPSLRRWVELHATDGRRTVSLHGAVPERAARQLREADNEEPRP